MLDQPHHLLKSTQLFAVRTTVLRKVLFARQIFSRINKPGSETFMIPASGHLELTLAACSLVLCVPLMRNCPGPGLGVIDTITASNYAVYSILITMNLE